MEDSNLDTFRETINRYPGISANKYDGLKIKRPCRRTLEKRYGVSWLGLIELAGGHAPLRQGGVETNKEGIYQKFNNKEGEIDVRKMNIVTLDEAIAMAEVDLSCWEVKQWLKNSWPVTSWKSGFPETITMHQVKVWFKPKVERSVEVALKEIIKDVPTFKFKRLPKFKRLSGIAGEIAIVDAHIGKLAWRAETGRPNYDLKISSSDYLDAIEQSLNYVSMFKPEKLFFVLGNDLFHIENFEGLTHKAGNILDTDSRFPKILKQGMETVIKAIYLCRDVAPTEILWIPGNHDLISSLMLSLFLEVHFEKDPYLNVDASPLKRKARLWGNLLVGWTHEITGRQNSWTNELSQAFPKLWGKSKFREWHHGHKHKKNEVKMYPVMTQGGVLLRQLTALSPIDAWHYDYLFTDAVPGGESFVWSKDNGVIANFTAWTTRNN